MRVLQQKEREDWNQHEPWQIRDRPDKRDQRCSRILDGGVSRCEDRTIDALAHFEGQVGLLVVPDPPLLPCTQGRGVVRRPQESLTHLLGDLWQQNPPGRPPTTCQKQIDNRDRQSSGQVSFGPRDVPRLLGKPHQRRDQIGEKRRQCQQHHDAFQSIEHPDSDGDCEGNQDYLHGDAYRR